MKKIMFNDRYGLTQAVLEGRKTQTRRVVSRKILDLVPQYQEEYYAGALESISVEDAIYNITHGERMAKASYYIGEEVAVAQNYDDIKEDTAFLRLSIVMKIEGKSFRERHGNKKYIKSECLPHRIRITNVRVERLQDISDEDCLKEGIHVDDNVPEGVPRCQYIAYSYDADPSRQKKRWWYHTPREAFAALIDKTCGRGTWDSNPWVFVYDFELIK